MPKHSVAIKIITNDGTIEEIINPDFSACGSGDVILKRNQPCKGDALDFVTPAGKSDKHARSSRRKRLKYSDPRSLQTCTVSFKDKRHLKTVEVTVHASADKAVHFDPKKPLLPHPAESSTASTFSCEVNPACDKHPETSEESLNTSTPLQPVTKTLQVLNSAFKHQATTRPIECPNTSKAATETEQTLNPPIVPQSTETTQTLSSPITTQSADKFQPFTLKKSTRLQKMTKPFPSNFTNPASAEMSEPAHAGAVVLPPITDDSQLIPSTPVNSTPVTLADNTCPEKNTGESSLVTEGSQPDLSTSDLQQVSLARVSRSHSTVSESDKVSSDADENSVTSTNAFDSPLYQWTKSDVARWLNFHGLGRYASQFSEMDGPCMVELVHCLHASPVILQAYLKEFGFSLCENCRLLALLRAFSKQVGLGP